MNQIHNLGTTYNIEDDRIILFSKHSNNPCPFAVLNLKNPTSDEVLNDGDALINPDRLGTDLVHGFKLYDIYQICQVVDKLMHTPEKDRYADPTFKISILNQQLIVSRLDGQFHLVDDVNEYQPDMIQATFTQNEIEKLKKMLPEINFDHAKIEQTN